ncbi:MAG: hypothetical protein ACOYEV_09795 [Candidatus Nanopelagicales bacterium]
MPNDDERNPDGHNPDKHEGEFDAVTRLFIRTNPADDGTEPLPGGLAFWTSPDIVIVQPGGAVGGEAVPLEVNQVRITVTNGGGMPAVDAYVEAFVADPMTVITPATAFALGGAFMTVQAYNTETIDFAWTPTAADSGHRCVIARVSLIVPPDTYVDPTIFDVVGDRHVAQRNIQVLAVAAGKSLSFRFAVQHAPGAKGAVRILARELTQKADGRELMKLAGCAGGLPAQRPLAGLGVRMISEREHRERANQVTGRLPAGLVSPLGEAIGRPELKTQLEPASQPQFATVTFQVAEGEESGRLHLVEVVQVDAETGMPQGGLTFVVRVE